MERRKTVEKKKEQWREGGRERKSNGGRKGGRERKSEDTKALDHICFFLFREVVDQLALRDQTDVLDLRWVTSPPNKCVLPLDLSLLSPSLFLCAGWARRSRGHEDLLEPREIGYAASKPSNSLTSCFYFLL